MRVITGVARGIKLKTISGNSTRPTIDRVKENMFNIINSYVYDSVVVDLFSGSGSLCIECLSRGAKEAYFIEKNRECISIIEENLEKTKLSENALIFNMDFESFLAKIKYDDLKFDIIFLDPPHNKGLGIKAMNIIFDNGVLSNKGIIVVEHHSEEQYLDEVNDFYKFKFKKYGNTSLSFYKHKGEN